MTRQKIIAGIDIGSSKTTTLIAAIAQEDGRIKIIGVSSIPSKGMRRGQIVNIEEASASLTTSVEAAERMAGYNLNQAYISVGGPQIVSQNSHGVVAVAEPDGEINDEDVRRVIEAARAVSLPSSREIIHVVPRNYTVDGQEGVKDPVGMSGVRLEVETHLVSGATTSLRNLTKCINEVGIDPQGLIFSGLAASDSVLTETDKELGVVLVDIGGGTTSVTIFVDGAPFYAAVLPVGARNITNDLAVGLRMSLDTAEVIKLGLSKKEKVLVLPEGETPKEKKLDEDELQLSDLGIQDEQKSVSKKTLIEGIIRPRLNEIFTMVGMEIKKSGAAGLTPSGIVVCGGGGLTPGVSDSAKRILAMPVRIGYPQGLSGLIDDIQTPEFAVVTGLLLRGSNTDTKTSTNFAFGNLGKSLHHLPVKGIFGRILDLLKSFLP